MSLTCSLLPLIMKNIILFALAEHINSTFAKIGLDRQGIAMPNVRARVLSILIAD